MSPHRRQLLRAGAVAPAALLMAGCQGQAPDARFRTWAAAVAAVQALRSQPLQVQGNPWSLSQVAQHLAQSIEYSITGYPALKPAWFRASLGSAAFSAFNAYGAMSHDRQEPIPGAPPLVAATPLPAALQRLDNAMAAFAAHTGPLAPHFAYGTLSHSQYQRAHLMHLAHHWTQFQAAPR